MTRDILLVFHFIGLALGMGTSFSHMFLGIASTRMERGACLNLQRAIARPLGLMGNIGLALLILSGTGLVFLYGSSLMQMPLFHAKMFLFVVLVGLIVPLNKLSKQIAEGDEQAIEKSERLGKITMPLGLAIIVLAVLSFH